MRYLITGLLLMSLLACGPKKSTVIHLLSLVDTNQGRALPVHVVPVDDALRVKLETMSAEEWFYSDEEAKLAGIFKTAVRGAQKEAVTMSRANNKNDFLIIVDYADIADPDQQKILLGKKYYQSGDIYILVGRERISVVSKKEFNQYLKTN